MVQLRPLFIPLYVWRVMEAHVNVTSPGTDLRSAISERPTSALVCETLIVAFFSPQSSKNDSYFCLSDGGVTNTCINGKVGKIDVTPC